MARLREREIVSFCNQYKDDFEKNHIVFECKAYQWEPFMHGFLLDDERLSVSFCGATYHTNEPLPYLQFNEADKIDGLDDKVTKQFVDVFTSWFDQQWEVARAIWPPAKASGLGPERV